MTDRIKVGITINPDIIKSLQILFPYTKISDIIAFVAMDYINRSKKDGKS